MTTPADPTAALKLARDALAYYATAGASGQPISGDIAADALAAIDALPAPSGGPAAKPVNGIKATMFHDEGAIAQCQHCKRYSLDPNTLHQSDSKQPVCECGKQHYWSGSFKKPGPDAKWSGAAPQAATAQAAPAPQAASPAPAVPAESGPPNGYEAITPFYTRWVSPSRWAKFSPAVQKWYRPYWLPAVAAPVQPLTEAQIVDGYCKAPHTQQYVSAFVAGARFAERAHGITATPAKE